ADRLEKAALEFPEVTRVVSRIGRPEIATDTIGPDESDVFVFLKPKDEWRFATRDALVEAMAKHLRSRVPETAYGFSQPIEDNVNDMIAGVKGDVAIHLYGDDLDRMQQVGRNILMVVGALPGAADMKKIPRSGLPMLNIEVDRAAVARYGINVADVLDAV